MGKKHKSDAAGPGLFVEESGQLRMVDKSAEQRAAESVKEVECLGMKFPSEEARRAYFMEKLREKLKDPAFRKIEGFPLGEDEDILALSDPPYYTACPNPFIGDFVKAYGKPYDPSKLYDRKPLSVDVSEGKNDPIYNAHSYHTKVPHQAIMQYILHYTEPGDVVLDTFCGSGMTGVAAEFCGRADESLRQILEGTSSSIRWGTRNAILCDLGPVTSLIAHNYNVPFNVRQEIERAESLLSLIESELGWAFTTAHTGWNSSDRTSKGRSNHEHVSASRGTVNFVLWSDVFLCPECSTEIVYWTAAADPENASVRESISCLGCQATLSKTQLQRAVESVFDPILKRVTSRRKQIPVLINYSIGTARFEKLPDDEDLEILRKSNDLEISARIPDQEFMLKGERWGDTWRSGYHYGFTHAHHFYTRRNLAVLAKVWEEAVRSKSAFLQFLFTSTHAWATRMNRLLVSNYFNKRGGVIGQTLSGTMYVSSIAIETNALARFRLRIESARHTAQSSGVLVTTQSATDLSSIPNDSIDYSFIDPPFGDNLYYAELNFLWEAWPRVYSNTKSEAVVSPSQKKNLDSYLDLMARSFAEIYRALKPGRWMTVEFHNSKNAVWNAIQEAILRAGFVIADVRTLEKTHKTYKQLTSANAVKQDLVISSYKPNGGLEARFVIQAGTMEGVWDFVREHLKHLPIFVEVSGEGEIVAERQNYLIFDRMVAFHIQRGVAIPVSASDFYAGLEQRFAKREGMYFLEEQSAIYDSERQKVKEIQQLAFIPQDETSAILWLRKELNRNPQNFPELAPKFMKDTTGWFKYEEHLELSQILAENFLCYTDTEESIPPQIWAWMQTNSTLSVFTKDHQRETAISAARYAVKNLWYVPDPNRASDLEKLRERALLKEFEGYRQSAQKKLKVFRTEAIRAGFKSAWTAKDYQTIIAVAQKLPEDVIQGDLKLLMWVDHARIRLGVSE